MAESNFLSPPELAKALVGAGVKKATLPISKMVLLGILAGVYIGFAGLYAQSKCIAAILCTSLMSTAS